MKKLLLFLSLYVISCNNVPDTATQKVQSFSGILQPGQRDSIQILGTDTAHFTGTPRTVYDWTLTSITSPVDTTPIPPIKPITFIVDTIPFSDPDLLAANRASNTFYNTIQKIAVPTDANPIAPDNEKRFIWTQMQTQKGSYNWAVFDDMLKIAISKGQRVSFGIGVITNNTSDGAILSGNAYLGYPVYVHNAMQLEKAKDWIPTGGCNPGNMWVPSWNSPILLSEFATFLLELNKHIQSGSLNGIAYKNVVAAVRLLGFGNYGGEWHTACAGRGIEPIGCKATVASLKAYIDMHLAAFNDWPLTIPVNAFCGEVCSGTNSEVGYYALTVRNSFGLLGWDSYHIGTNEEYAQYDVMKNTCSWNGIPLRPLILDRYKYAPVAGEPMNSESAQTTNGVQFALMEQQVRDYHTSRFNNSWTFTSLNSQGLTNFRNASKLSGYRLQIGSGSYASVKGILTLNINWNNIGLAPIYENWDVWFELRNGTSVAWSSKSKFNPKFLLGNQSVTDIFTGVPVGSYSLYVILKDPSGYRKPLAMANKNVGKDGGILLSNININ